MKTNYIKPASLCVDVKPIGFEDKSQFIAYQKGIYNTQLKSLNLSIRLATMNDRERIMELRNERFTVPNSYTTHWFYHLFNYGSCILLENAQNELVGYKFEATYMDEFKTSFTAGTAVKASYAHLGLGKLLIGYCHLIAMEKGALVNRGIIDIVNYPSVYNFINHFGGVFIDFEPHFKNYGARLIYQIPLDEHTPSGRKIDFDKVKTFISEHQANQDFYLVECSEVERLQYFYKETTFRVVALLPKTFMQLTVEHYLLLPF